MDADGPATERGRSRLVSVGGALSLLYAVWASVDLLVLAWRGSTFTELHRRYGNAVVRVVLCAVLLGVVHHALDGLRAVVEDLLPASRRVDRGLRHAVRFLTPALAIPGALVVLWPVVRGWFG